MKIFSDEDIREILPLDKKDFSALPKIQGAPVYYDREALQAAIWPDADKSYKVFVLWEHKK